MFFYNFTLKMSFTVGSYTIYEQHRVSMIFKFIFVLNYVFVGMSYMASDGASATKCNRKLSSGIIGKGARAKVSL